MQVRWSVRASDDLSRIAAYLQQENLSVAERICKDIYDRIGALSTFPYRGRIGRVEGTRELPLPPLPFVVVYRIREGTVEVSNILHGAQRWP